MPTTISFETIDDLERLRSHLEGIGRVSRRVRPNGFPLIDEKLALLEKAQDEALASVENAIEEARATFVPELADLSVDESERISQFDRVLRDLTDLLQRECAQAQHDLETRLAAPSDPMADFEIDVRINYGAHEHVQGYCEDSDNFLSSREYQMRRRAPMDFCILSGEWGNSIESKNKDPSRCWLFYDLTEHDWGVTGPCVPVQQISQIGSIWAEVVIRRQYFIEAQTGKWVWL
ncbi:MAG: hypothetical protein ABTQ25_14805 [Nitrosomonas ureae]